MNKSMENTNQPDEGAQSSREDVLIALSSAAAADAALAGSDDHGQGSGGGSNLCDMCGKLESKYKCPGCDTRTCGLACVKSHKEKLSCDGKRKRTAFVGMKEFSDRHLRSDMRFLEDLGRESGAAARKRRAVEGDSGSGVTTGPPRAGKRRQRGRRDESEGDEAESAPAMPRNLKALVDAAAKRDIDLLVMPQGMSRRKENSSHVNHRKKEIIWRVVWHARGDSFTDKGLGESVSILEGLRRKLPQCTPTKVLLRVWAGSPVEVDTAKTLKEALSGCKILEFPEFEIIEQEFSQSSQTQTATSTEAAPEATSVEADHETDKDAKDAVQTL